MPYVAETTLKKRQVLFTPKKLSVKESVVSDTSPHMIPYVESSTNS